VKTLIVASANAGKIREVSMALSDLADWNVESLPPELPEVEKSGNDFMENAIRKAIHFSKLIHGLTLADDSGLSVKADTVATFYCALAVARLGQLVWTVQTDQQVLFVESEAKTLAQMTPIEKNTLSARGQALVQLRDFLAAI
jgi:inosine/xanthosine triphosphate pyrophosphatase family protein